MHQQVQAVETAVCSSPCFNHASASIYSERKKLKDRDEAWAKLEELASLNSSQDASKDIKAASMNKLSGASAKAEVAPLSAEFGDAMMIGDDGAENAAGDEVDDDDDDYEDDQEDDLMNSELKQFEDRPAPQGRFRRKSVLPVDEQVLSELSRHKSLEDLINNGKNKE